MYEIKRIEATPDLLRKHFLQIYNQLLIDGSLWGMNFDVDSFKSRFSEQLSSSDFSSTSIEELFSFISVRSSSYPRNYPIPESFLILDNHKVQGLDPVELIQQDQRLYNINTWGGNEDFAGLEYCNEVYLIDLETGNNVQLEDGSDLIFQPLFWERGEVYLDFIEPNTFIAREDDPINGSSNTLYEIQEGIAIEIELNEEDEEDY